MEKLVTIGNQQVQMRASALIPRLYRVKFGRDMMRDMHQLQKSARDVYKGQLAGEDTDFSAADMTMFENLAYMMAKHADATVPDTVEDWLAGIDGVLSIYTALPEMVELWMVSNQTTAVPVKK